MITKSFFGPTISGLKYELLPAKLPEPDKIEASRFVTLLHPKPADHLVPALFRPGDRVQTGQKISLFADTSDYVIATATGMIASISPFTGDLGRSYLAIRINLTDAGIADHEFEKTIQRPSLEGAINFLTPAPGRPPLHIFSDPEKDIRTIVICGTDSDLLVETNQYVVKSRLKAVNNGIQVLKTITGVDHILLTVTGESLQAYGHLEAEVKRVQTVYPSALPHLIMKDVLGQVVPAGKSCEDMGVCFFSAEAAASIGSAFESGRLPIYKIITLIGKDGSRKLIEVPIGAPLRDIFETCGISLNERDRVVFGGPMQGLAVYSLEHPIQPDTDAVMVLDPSQAAHASDYPCINCGKCVRACPARIPVNLLIRYLEAGQYEPAADNYDLYSCIECGLCSYVCVSSIPIFQYIKLAKHELERAQTLEATHA